MNVAALVDALALPPDARVDQRVPKKLLLEQGAPTAADKRQITGGIEEMLWITALKPTNIGVPEYRDAVREYLEIAVLTVTLRPLVGRTSVRPGGLKSTLRPRLVELIHRAIPYPVVLVAEHGDTVGLSLARQLRSHLQAVYQGWIACIMALAAARITGAFVVPDTAERAVALRHGLDAHGRLNRELAALRAAAERERHLNRRVALNLEIKRLEAELAATSRSLEGNDR